MGTTTGIVSGIGNFFGKAGDAIMSSSPDKDKALNSVLGQAAFKREFAYQFGVIVGIFPLDHVAWSAGFARKEMAVSDAIDRMQGIKGKELWIAGTVDPMARSALENRGWKVEDRVAEKLLKK